MLRWNKKLYDETCSIKKGTTKLSPCIEAVRRRLSAYLSVPIVSVVYDKIEIGPAKGKPRLNVILELEEDRKQFQDARFRVKSNTKQTIMRVFSDAVRELRLHAEFETTDPLVILDGFSAEAMNQAAFQLFQHDEKALIARFSSDRIWRITGMTLMIVVFFIDDEAKRIALAGDACDRIRQACFETMKRYDEFNYVTLENLDVRFDSKENLDKGFEGSLLYYFR